MYYRRFVKNILLVIFPQFFLLVFTIVIVDPLQVFHKSWLHPGKYVVRNIRESAYGVITSRRSRELVGCEQSQRLPLFLLIKIHRFHLNQFRLNVPGA